MDILHTPPKFGAACIFTPRWHSHSQGFRRVREQPRATDASLHAAGNPDLAVRVPLLGYVPRASSVPIPDLEIERSVQERQRAAHTVRTGRGERPRVNRWPTSVPIRIGIRKTPREAMPTWGQIPPGRFFAPEV
jgi:hypothetical protein